MGKLVGKVWCGIRGRLHLCHKIRDEDTAKSVLGCQP